MVGERAHYELAAGNYSEARRLLKVIEAQMSPGGFIPEQIWDAEDKPRKELINGKPSGSAMPLVWAHAEYIKLLRSLQDGKSLICPLNLRSVTGKKISNHRSQAGGLTISLASSWKEKFCELRF